MVRLGSSCRFSPVLLAGEPMQKMIQQLADFLSSGHLRIDGLRFTLKSVLKG